MEVVLADALLSRCGDRAALLRALSAPLCAERAEALRLLLQRLAAGGPAAAGEAEALRRAAWEVALERCRPLLRGGEGGGERLRAARAARGALRHCVQLCGAPLAARLARDALAELAAGGGAQEAAVEALVAAAPRLEEPELLSRCAAAALALVREEGEGEAAAALVAGRLLPALGANGAALPRVWEGLLGAGAAPRAGRALLALSALADALLPRGPAGTGLDARLCPRFWRLVQEGLTERDGLCRKRARYLLKRALDLSGSQRAELRCAPDGGHECSLFWWSAEKNEQLLQFWETYILIMETLEGNQIHVIKPVLPKLNSLYELAISEDKGCWLFHPSWHVCIYRRMFESENKTLTKEGILHFLELYETKHLPNSLDFSEFVIGPLMDALSESSLYSRTPGQSVGSCPPLGLRLQKFLATYFTLLPEEEKGSFLLKFIQKMTSRHWCAVPVLFLSMALASIPACKVLGAEGLHALRDVLQCTMITHQILLRGAAQCYLLQTTMHLTDVEKVSFPEVSSFLLSLRPEESLRRDTLLWTELCSWLQVNDKCFRKSATSDFEHQETSSLCQYVHSLVGEYLKTAASERENCFMPDWFEAKLVSTMILLAADVEQMKNKYSGKSNIEWIELEAFLNPLLDVLMKLGSNAYIPTLRADKSLQLLLKLLQTRWLKCSNAQDDEVLLFIWKSLVTPVESILEFILRRLTTNELSTVGDLDRCDLYLALIPEIVNLCLKVNWKKIPSIKNFLSSLINASIRNLQERNSEKEPKVKEQIRKVAGMASLAAVCEIMGGKLEVHLEPLPSVDALKKFISFSQFNEVLKKPSYIEEKNSLCEETASQGWGKVVARYVRDQWICLRFVLNSFPTLAQGHEETSVKSLSTVERSKEILQSALEALSILPSDQVSPVFDCMKVLVPKLLDSSEALCIEAFDLAWKITSSLSNTQLIFWANLKAFVQFIFDTEVLAVAASAKGQAYAKIKEIIFKLIDLSTTKTGVFNVALSHCCQSWIFPSVDERCALRNDFLNAGSYSDLITEACVFGTVFRRDQRHIQDVHAFIENLGEKCAANVVTESTNRDDHYIRICAVKFLCLLDASNISHKTFMEDIFIKLLDKDELVSRSRTRYYANSLQHRIKTRVWQTLLVLLPKLNQNFLCGTLDRVFQAGFSNNQASVKYFIEWMVILCLHKYPQFLDKFWDCFCYDEEKLKKSICTFLSVLAHFDIILENTSEKKPAVKKALIVVLQWCFSHNFSVRLYALIALKKIWGMCRMLHVEEFAALTPVIESSLQQVENMHGTGNARRNWQRIQDHFFFATFHPVEDYSLETIFYTLPRLSELAEDEWMSLSKFDRFTDIPLPAAFQWCHSRAELRDLKPSDWSQQDMGKTQPVCIHCSHSAEADSQPEWTDVQKKIIPWKNSTPSLDLETAFEDRAAKLGKSNSRLIVVASLIDKPTNLGGLCRTSEIFGASALVVGSLHYIQDKQFQHLSVSAEQWLPLVEVKPCQLVDYLQQKKTEGYTIIGVEQTAKSFDLTEYCFPEKSLLLLGNEHEGIPANLIHHLDVCVEIPQQGIIRSLNVHVSGALLIWEYTRQQVIKQKQQQ
ncbi:probable methyltransferase TARBP1 isoform X1 [Oenanthe melanoleuca]|uniref:probable methyltransferase TARBP1 isoform X1 n=1 Tax=Oenanthe melanoleuca TaxID=2939378 RepID=UPI0024C1982E|nr:probable methyltransferase TARBP1 isoform X1 [Oenanthe melanoleuca]